jgi:DNA-binding CsgD family transcriptional regulator
MDDRILELRLKGLSYKRIANQLGICRTTVEYRTKKIFETADKETKENLENINQLNKTTKTKPILDDEILKLRLEKLTYEQIANKLSYSKVSIEKRLKSIYLHSNQDIKNKLDNIKFETRRKKRINLATISPYLLGIIWGLGRYSEEGAMFFRHSNRYFLEQLQNLCDNEITEGYSRTGTQYKLKSVLFDIDQLKQIGWTERNADERDIPKLIDYKDFLRSYIEIHGYLSENRNNKGLRLRIYGNIELIQSINEILSNNAKVRIKRLTISKNEKTAALSYQLINEIQSIFSYISGEPKYIEYWQAIEEKLEVIQYERN